MWLLARELKTGGRVACTYESTVSRRAAHLRPLYFHQLRKKRIAAKDVGSHGVCEPPSGPHTRRKNRKTATSAGTLLQRPYCSLLARVHSIIARCESLAAVLQLNLNIYESSISTTWLSLVAFLKAPFHGEGGVKGDELSGSNAGFPLVLSRF